MFTEVSSHCLLVYVLILDMIDVHGKRKEKENIGDEF